MRKLEPYPRLQASISGVRFFSVRAFTIDLVKSPSSTKRCKQLVPPPGAEQDSRASASSKRATRVENSPRSAAKCTAVQRVPGLVLRRRAGLSCTMPLMADTLPQSTASKKSNVRLRTWQHIFNHIHDMTDWLWRLCLRLPCLRFSGVRLVGKLVGPA